MLLKEKGSLSSVEDAMFIKDLYRGRLGTEPKREKWIMLFAL